MQQVAAALAKPGFQQAAANLAWLLAERAIRFVLSLCVGFVVARYLGPARLGSLSYCTALVTLVGGLAALGLDAIVRRDVIAASSREAVVLASASVLRGCAGALACALLLFLGWTGAVGTPEEQRLLAILAFMVFQPALLVPDMWLQARLRAKYSVAVQLGALACGSMLRLWLVVEEAPLRSFAIVTTVEAAIVAIGMQTAARRAGLRFAWVEATWSEMRRLLSESWPLMFAALAVTLYMKIDEVMLRFLVGPAAVGIYSAATRLTEIWYFVPTALASSLLPALLRARERGDGAYRDRVQRYYDLNAALAYGVSIPMALASTWIVRLAYGPNFAASAPIVAVHIWSSVFVFVGVARGQWLVNERLQRFYLTATMAGALLNIGLNFVLIPRWGGFGAAIATVLSQASAAWLSSFCSAATRETGRMQARALLVPVLGWRYLRRS